jgi:hypothetical protein
VLLLRCYAFPPSCGLLILCRCTDSKSLVWLAMETLVPIVEGGKRKFIPARVAIDKQLALKPLQETSERSVSATRGEIDLPSSMGTNRLRGSTHSSMGWTAFVSFLRMSLTSSSVY